VEVHEYGYIKIEMQQR